MPSPNQTRRSRRLTAPADDDDPPIAATAGADVRPGSGSGSGSGSVSVSGLGLGLDEVAVDYEADGDDDVVYAVYDGTGGVDAPAADAGGEIGKDGEAEAEIEGGPGAEDHPASPGEGGGGGASASASATQQKPTVSASTFRPDHRRRTAAAVLPPKRREDSAAPSVGATGENVAQAMLRGLDIVRQVRGAAGGGSYVGGGSVVGTDLAVAGSPPSSGPGSLAGGGGGGGGGGPAGEEEGEVSEGGGAVGGLGPGLEPEPGLVPVGSAALSRPDCDRDRDRRDLPQPRPRATPDRSAASSSRPAAAALHPAPSDLGVYVPPYKRRQMEEDRRKALEEQQQERGVDGAGGLADDGTGLSDSNRSSGCNKPAPQPAARAATDLSTQRQSWSDLKRAITGTVNRLSPATIRPLIHSLFATANLIRGRGVLARTVLRAASVSPAYAPAYAALVAVVNAKLPEVGELVLTRAVLQFRRSYGRRDRAATASAANFLGFLFGQNVCHELLSLQLLTVLLDGEPTDDSVEVAVGYMRVVGRRLGESSPAGVRAVLERFRGLLHEGGIGKRVQYAVEGLLADARAKFESYPSVVPELDLVEADDQIVLEIGLDDEGLRKEEVLDVFRFDPDWDENEAVWKRIRGEILGEEDSESGSGSGGEGEEETDSGSDGSGSDGEGGDDDEDEDEDYEPDQELALTTTSGGVGAAKPKPTTVIHDLTETDLIHLRRTIYLTIMSSATFEECTHKLSRLTIPPGSESELINMIIECCSQERTFLRYYGLISARFCLLDRRWRDAFGDAFREQYGTIHRLETNKLRNVAKLFAHLLHTDSVPWDCLSAIRLNEDETTSSSRIFVKILVQEMAEAMGMVELRDRFEFNLAGATGAGGRSSSNRASNDPDHEAEWYAGMFPRDVPRNTRYAINFFTSIGLGPLTDGLREHLKNAPKLILEQARKEADARAASAAADDNGDGSSVSSSSVSSTSSSSGSSSASSSSDSGRSSSSYSSDSRRDQRRGHRSGGERRPRRREDGRSRSSSFSSSLGSSSSSPSGRSSRRQGRGRRRGYRGGRSRSRTPPSRCGGGRRRSYSRSVSRTPSRNRSRSPGRDGERKKSPRSPSRNRNKSPPPRRGGRSSAGGSSSYSSGSGEDRDGTRKKARAEKRGQAKRGDEVRARRSGRSPSLSLSEKRRGGETVRGGDRKRRRASSRSSSSAPFRSPGRGPI